MKKIGLMIDESTYFSGMYTLILSYLLAILISLLVFLTGGTIHVYANFLYVPIVLAAVTWGIKQSIILAIFSGLLVGPFMPLNVELGLMQQTNNWVIRILIYTLVALITGYFADKYKKTIESVISIRAKVIKAQLATIYSLVRLSESRDEETGTHIQRVAEYCKLIACELKDYPEYDSYINDDYISNLYSASPLHDVGKVAIPDKILLKPAKLSSEEFEIIKTHTTLGAKTLEDVKKQYPDNKFLDVGTSITLTHHEKWDGSGYPLGLKGKEIPLSGRIMALADVYDALRSKRVYKIGYSHTESVEIIKSGAGVHFDPQIVEVFLKINQKFNLIFSEYSKANMFFDSAQ